MSNSQSGASPICESYAKLYGDTKHLEKELNKGWLKFWHFKGSSKKGNTNKNLWQGGGGGRGDAPCLPYSGGLDDTASVVLRSIDSIFFDKKYKNFR